MMIKCLFKANDHRWTKTRYTGIVWKRFIGSDENVLADDAEERPTFAEAMALLSGRKNHTRNLTKQFKEMEQKGVGT